MEIIDKMSIKSNFVRKSISYLKQVPKGVKRICVNQEDYFANPPIIVNSIPKSGTHLLLQILKTIPDVHSYGSFIAEASSFSMIRRSDRAIDIRINSLLPGEVVGAHLTYNKNTEQSIKDINAVHYFIYRDPRDVAISEALYLTYMNQWHCLHPNFLKNFNNDQERILFSITGDIHGILPIEWQNIANRIFPFVEWIKSSEVCAVKYEDLNNPDNEGVLRKIFKFYLDRSRKSGDNDKLIRMAKENMNPKKSHTFREGRIGKWRNVFNEEHSKAFETIGTDLIKILNY